MSPMTDGSMALSEVNVFSEVMPPAKPLNWMLSPAYGRESLILWEELCGSSPLAPRFGSSVGACTLHRTIVAGSSSR